MVIDLVKYRKEQKFNKLYAKVDSEASYHLPQYNDTFCEMLCDISTLAFTNKYDKANEMLVNLDKTLHDDPDNLVFDYMYHALMSGHPDLISGTFYYYGYVHSFCGLYGVVDTLDDIFSSQAEFEMESIQMLMKYPGHTNDSILFHHFTNEINDIFNHFFRLTGILDKDDQMSYTGMKIQRLGQIPKLDKAGFHSPILKFPWSKLFDYSKSNLDCLGINFCINLRHLHNEKPYNKINQHIFFKAVIYSLCRLARTYQNTNVIPIKTYSNLLYKRLRKFDKKMTNLDHKMYPPKPKKKFKPNKKQSKLLKLVKDTKTKIKLNN